MATYDFNDVKFTQIDFDVAQDVLLLTNLPAAALNFVQVGNALRVVNGNAFVTLSNVSYAALQSANFATINGSLVRFGAAGDDTIFGSAKADYAEGAGGNDTLFGGDGNDQLRGGAGDDWLFGDSGADALYGGDGDDFLYGGSPTPDDAADSLFGGAGNDRILVSLGGDLVDGGEGDDLAILDLAYFGLPVTFTAATGSATAELQFGEEVQIRLRNIERFKIETGGSDDRLILSAAGGADEVVSGAGNDFIDAGGGNDTLYGGLGDDTLNGGAGDDLLQSDDVIDSPLGKDVIDGGDGSDTLDGGYGDDILLGGAGDDVLTVTGDGNDSLSGGDGNDTLNFLAYEPGNRFVIEGGAGSDTLHMLGQYPQSASAGMTIDVKAAGDTIVLTAGVESGRIRGVEKYDVIGGFGNDVFKGGTGADTLFGNAGDDKLFGRFGQDQLFGGAGKDNLDGGDQDDSLSGGGGKDVLRGGNHNDVLIGGADADNNFGGTGADRFVYLAASDSGFATALRDRISDFRRSDGDRIDLSAIDANTGTAENDAFVWSNDGFHGVAGEVHAVYNSKAKLYNVFADLDGDRVADFAINVVSTTALVESDFLL